MSLEFVNHDGRTYCLIIRRTASSDSTAFLTSDDSPLQVGFIKRLGGEPIPRHVHIPQKRTIDQTWEFLLVREGAMTMTIYSDDRQRLSEHVLEEGDSVLLMGGGHGFEPRGDLLLLEVKQGPYTEGKDKERF